MRSARKGPAYRRQGRFMSSLPPFHHSQAVEVAPQVHRPRPAPPLEYLPAEDHQDDEDQERQLAVDHVKEST